jgi:hypothetical protein
MLYIFFVGLKQRGWEGLDWINLAHDRDKWWVTVNRAMDIFRFHKMPVTYD